MSIVQCPVQGCDKVFTDRGDLVTHRDSHDVATLFKDPVKKPRKRSRSVKAPSAPDMGRLRADTARRAHGRCEAHGLHDPRCPGQSTTFNDREFNAHHVHPREFNGPDELGNLIWVWGGTGLGAGGCHAKCHTTIGRVLGLLKHKDEDPFSGIGIRAALALGFIGELELRNAGLDPEQVFDDVGWCPENRMAEAQRKLPSARSANVEVP